MARITVEDCEEKVENGFALVVLGAQRARLLANGAETRVESDNTPAVTALREIAAGRVYFVKNIRTTIQEFIEENRDDAR